ncbi:hypothetical protein [Ralstonia pseudosolanacearum]|uniref:hypothetical protein n=1 Tax=Ralstonia pseudosolanacearum TaxID=1310165 RepID=UPI00073D2DBB
MPHVVTLRIDDTGFVLLGLTAATMRHWYAKTRNRWKSVSAFACVVHHQTFIRYLRDDERYALIIPDDDRDWLG